MTPPRGGRIERRFAALKGAGRAGLVTFVTAGDPDAETSLALLQGLPGAGADLVELGMPFSDPMADGPAIQAAGQRALKAGMTLKRTLELARTFRLGERETPLVLMGYYNPIYSYGPQAFVRDAEAAGVDGLIVVDLPLEEEDELAPLAAKAGIALIRLVAPTTRGARLARVLAGAAGFIYYVAITGITGTRSAELAAVKSAVEELRRHTALPLAVGFGIKTPEDAAGFARFADAAVVGSALVEVIAHNLDKAGRARPELVPEALAFVRRLSAAVRNADAGSARDKVAT